MSETNKVVITLNKDAVLNQYPDMLVKCNYLETDTFEGGLEYGEETIRIEPPLNRVFYVTPEGVSITYLGSNRWQLEASVLLKSAIKLVLRKLIPVQSVSI